MIAFSTEPPRPVRADAPPDAFQDQDALLELEEEITTLAAHINVAEHRFLRLVAEFDRRGGLGAAPGGRGRARSGRPQAGRTRPTRSRTSS